MNFPIHQPYKDGKGGVDIGLKPIQIESWLEIDNLFSTEIAEKKKLLKNKRSDVLITPSSSFSIQKEVLTTILEHLQLFHANLFNINKETVEIIKTKEIYNHQKFPNPLELASMLVQEDLIIMKQIEEDYHLESASLCAPTRWSLKDKFRESLSEIHKEVPGYEQKIGKRVDSIFTNLPDDKIFERFNWSIFDSPELFQPINSKTLVEIRDLRPQELFIRVERQTIRRLEHSKSVLFTVRVHVDPITAILDSKRSIEDLITAISNLDLDMKNYKVITPFEENLINWLKSKAINE